MQRALVKKTFFAAIATMLSTALMAQTNSYTLNDWPATAAPLKPTYVKAIMEQAGVHGVTFTRDAQFYLDELDKFARLAQDRNYRPYLKTPVAQNLATLAVVHCDWHNGVAPWEFAQKYLGKEQLALLQSHYPDAIAKLQNNCE